MGPRKQDAFTLLELLVVVAIIGILAAVVFPNLINARAQAHERAADAYAHSVYKAAYAHLAEDVGNALVAGNCVSGYAAGSYSVPDPGTNVVAACTVAGDTNAPTVTITTATRNRSINLP